MQIYFRIFAPVLFNFNFVKMKDYTETYRLLGNETFDVTYIPRARKIIYLKEEGVVVIKCTPKLAYIENEEKYGGRGVVMSPATAARLYPRVFTNCKKSERKTSPNGKKTLLITMDQKMYDFCYQKASMADYIRSLIRKDMEYAEQHK